MIAQLLTPFGTPFDIAVIAGAVLTVTAMVLSRYRRSTAGHTHERAHTSGSDHTTVRGS